MSGTWLKSLISEGLQASDECHSRHLMSAVVGTQRMGRSTRRAGKGVRRGAQVSRQPERGPGAVKHLGEPQTDPSGWGIRFGSKVYPARSVLGRSVQGWVCILEKITLATE